MPAMIDAEKRHYDAAQPFKARGFSIGYRNPGHWDVMARQAPGYEAAWHEAHPHGSMSTIGDGRERAFRIRGEPGNVLVHDERWNPHQPHPREPIVFSTVAAALVWIAGQLAVE